MHCARLEFAKIVSSFPSSSFSPSRSSLEKLKLKMLTMSPSRLTASHQRRWTQRSTAYSHGWNRQTRGQYRARTTSFSSSPSLCCILTSNPPLPRSRRLSSDGSSRKLDLSVERSNGSTRSILSSTLVLSTLKRSRRTPSRDSLTPQSSSLPSSCFPAPSFEGG